MTTEQKEELLAWAEMGTNNDIISYVEMLEKQAAIDALAKAERIEEKHGEPNYKLLNAMDNLLNQVVMDCSISSDPKLLNLCKVWMESKNAYNDALAKTNPIPPSEFERYLAICAQRGTFAVYLTNFIDQMTPDQREIIAIQFDQNLFGTDKAMAERFRKANNTEPINN